MIYLPVKMVISSDRDNGVLLIIKDDIPPIITLLVKDHAAK
jgi:hypothetical protein